MAAEEEVMVPGDRAAKLVGISRQRLYYWERTNLIRPTYRKQFSPRSIVRLYDLAALTELKVAATIALKGGDHGVGVRQLRPLLERLRATHAAPLRTLRWGIAGRTLYYNDGSGWQGGDQIPGQFALRGTLKVSAIRASLRRQVQRKRPSRSVGRIAKHRDVLASTPIFEGTRVAVSSVWEFLEEGEPLSEILAAYPDLSEADIRKARRLREAARQAKAGSDLAAIRSQFPELSEVEVKSARQLRAMA